MTSKHPAIAAMQEVDRQLAQAVAEKNNAKNFAPPKQEKPLTVGDTVADVMVKSYDALADTMSKDREEMRRRFDEWEKNHAEMEQDIRTLGKEHARINVEWLNKLAAASKMQDEIAAHLGLMEEKSVN